MSTEQEFDLDDLIEPIVKRPYITGRTPEEVKRIKNEQRKVWRKNNPDKVIASAKRCYDNDKDKNIARVIKYRKEHLEWYGDYSRRYRIENKETIIIKNREWAKNNPEAIKEHGRRKWLKQKYKITPEQYDELYRKQDGLCAICGNPEIILGSNKKGIPNRLAVDHCHDSSKNRGLLCFKCNTGLGHFNHDIELLNKTILYLNLFNSE